MPSLLTVIALQVSLLPQKTGSLTRSRSFYVLIIWAVIMWLSIFLLVPETYHPVLLRRKAIMLRAETGDERYQAPIERLTRSITMTVITSCYRPFQLLFFEPMCLLICLLSAVLLGILYLFFGAFPLVFGNGHGFELWQIGLTFLGIFVGMMVGVASDVIWKKRYAELVRKYSEETGIENNSEPEFRLTATIVGAWVVPIALFGKFLLLCCPRASVYLRQGLAIQALYLIIVPVLDLSIS
jgi:hypothetical protein